MSIPARPKLYHIAHVDRLPSIIGAGCLWCDAEGVRRDLRGTSIGMGSIKQRRLNNRLNSHPDLHVGECVPFYFCPRSVMLYLIYRCHPELTYRGGQAPIVHLEADLLRVVEWAGQQGRRWAFTLSNAGSYFFEDRNDLARLGEIDWAAVQARDWRACKDGKQAEFLLERSFPWHLVERIGVHSPLVYQQCSTALAAASHRPAAEVLRDWYY